MKVTYKCGCEAGGDNVSPSCPMHGTQGVEDDLALILARSHHSMEQYQKIQDFVICNYLWRGQPDSKSHADITIELAKEALAKRRAEECQGKQNP